MSDDLLRLTEDHEPQHVPQKGAAVERLCAAWSRRKWLALGVFALPFVAAISLIFSMPPLYRSMASVLVERQQVPEAFVRPTVTSDVETRLRTISQEILSRSRLDALITRFGLYPDLRKTRSNEEVVERMRSDIRLDFRGADLRAEARRSPSPSATGGRTPIQSPRSRIRWRPSISKRTSRIASARPPAPPISSRGRSLRRERSWTSSRLG